MSAGIPSLLNAEEELEEKEHIKKIIAALRYYRKYSYGRVNKTENYLNSLPQRHQNMLIKYRNHLNNIRDCIDGNQNVIKKMLQENILCSDALGAGSEQTMTQDIDGHGIKIRHQDMEYPDDVDVEPFKFLKAQSTLKLIARDWSAEGAEERAQSYKPIVDAIEEFYNPNEYPLNAIKILVPGAGLGRLTYELACRGYECEGNEFSYFMLIASNFVLNQCAEENKYILYPWVHHNVNNLLMADQIAAIRFPDVCPAKNPPKGNILMAAGDFIEVYKAPNAYDCVATCFFIDCANNVVEFIETIYRILVPGGIWVNLGPLLYHYSDTQGENSIEPTYENLVLIIEMIGFEIIRNKVGIRTKYAQNPNSMLKSEYESIFWICRKPLNAVNNVFDNDRNDDDKRFCNGDNDVNHESTYQNGFNE